MRMSEGVEWGLHVCFALGVAGDEPVPVARLAEFHGIAAAYLQKHLQSLVSAGILESVPGRRGGFRLARQPDEIRLLDVVDAIEGSDPPFHCTEIRQRGPYPAPRALCRRPCQITRAMRRAEQAWRRELARQTIADIIAAVGRDYVQAFGERQAVAAEAQIRDWLSARSP